MTTVQFGIASENTNHWPFLVAQDKGFFSKENINLDLIITRSSVGGVQAVQGGSISMVTATADAVVTGIAKGANLRIIGGFNRAAYVLVVKRDIKSYEQLRGKTLGVSAIQGGETPVLRAMLNAHGLKPDDYQIIIAGGTPERSVALKAGSVDGIVTTPPLDGPLVKDGFNLLGNSLEVMPDSAFLALAGNKEWMDKNPEVTVRVLRALVGGMDWLLSPANKEEAIKILATRLRTSPEDALATYNSMIPISTPVFYPKLRMTDASLKTAMDPLAEAGIITPAQNDPTKYTDYSFLERAIR
ncbi:MAG: ABC transporter substrate-binding protein [Chloroflexi bacterium]|nr:ABC transporter substrate-binding protein [Chloroflexota bacterium]